MPFLPWNRVARRGHGSPARPARRTDSVLIAGRELVKAVFAEERFGGVDKLTLSQQALGHVVASFDDHRQWLVGLSHHEVGNSLLGPLGGDCFRQWHGLESLVECF